MRCRPTNLAAFGSGTDLWRPAFQLRMGRRARVPHACWQKQIVFASVGSASIRFDVARSYELRFSKVFATAVDGASLSAWRPPFRALQRARKCPVRANGLSWRRPRRHAACPASYPWRGRYGAPARTRSTIKLFLSTLVRERTRRDQVFANRVVTITSECD